MTPLPRPPHHQREPASPPAPATRPEARPGVASKPRVKVHEPEPEVAREMLLAGLPGAVPPVVPEQGPFRSLAVDRLGRWPLLVTLIAAELALGTRQGRHADPGA